MKSIYIMVLPEIAPGVPFEGEFVKEDGFEIVKIGISKDVEKRRRAIFRDHKSITVGTTFSLPFTDNDAFEIESVLHNNFAHYRIDMSNPRGENLIEYFKVNKVTLEDMRHQLIDFCLAHLPNVEVEVRENQEEVIRNKNEYNRIVETNRRLESEIIIKMRDILSNQERQFEEVAYKNMISQLLRSLLGDKSVDKDDLILSALKMIEGLKKDGEMYR